MQKNYLDEALENFDAEANSFDDEFDADANNFAPKTATRSKITRSSFDLVIANPTAQTIPVELFNTLNSLTIKKRTDLAVATYSYIPQLSTQGLAAAGLGIVGWDQDGKLVFTSTNNALPNATVSCSQFPYRGLFQSIVSQKFIIRRMRMTFTSAAQIDNTITHFKSSFFGSTSQNTISPREYFDPTQQQGLIVDVNGLNLPIDGKRGLLMNINTLETVRINFQVDRIAD